MALRVFIDRGGKVPENARESRLNVSLKVTALQFILYL